MASDPQCLILDICKKCSDIVDSYLAIEHNSTIINDTKLRIKESLEIFEQHILSKWSPFCDHETETNFLSISYNGGKDCQVLLILYLASLYKKYAQHLQSVKLRKIYAVYLKTYENFDSLLKFIESSCLEYQLQLYVTQTAGMETALREYLASLKLEHQEQTGILLGTRATDARNYTMTTIQPTDKNYPKFIRLQPILNWKLANIWSFLLYSDEPHCELYDLGYTSLGKPCETVPNPWLINNADNGNLTNISAFDFEFKSCKMNQNTLKGDRKFLPGWFLLDDLKERDGRVSKIQK